MGTEPRLEERVRATRRPSTWALGYQKWRHLLFLHWEVPEDALRPHVPAGLTIDTFEGRAFVGVISFTMRGVRPRFLPALPRLSAFHELNVRTYVHYRGRGPGVWFFSLDAASLPAVLAARAGWRLPYYQAEMRLSTVADTIYYRSERQPPGPIPARLEMRYRVGQPLGVAQPGTLEFFLVERYLLYADWGSAGLKVGPVHHRAYPLRRADVLDLECATMLESAGLPAPSGSPHVLYSPGVDVEIFPLRGLEAR